MFSRFVEEAVRLRILSILQHGYSENKERGGVAGMERCLKLPTMEHFEAELERCRKADERLRGKGDPEKYWEQRMFTLQVEHVYKLLCAAAHANKWPGYEKLPLFARSAIEYDRITKNLDGVDER